MKLNSQIESRHKQTLDHLNRIQGQIATLKKYVGEGRSCADIAQLTTSIAKSFDSLRARTLEGFIFNELLEGRKPVRGKLDKLGRILKLYQK